MAGRSSSTAPQPPPNLEAFSKFRLACVDASRIAQNNQIGSRTHPIVNTSMMGAVARVLGMPPLEDVVAAIRDEVPGDAERNVAAAKEAYEAVRFVEPQNPPPSGAPGDPRGRQPDP